MSNTITLSPAQKAAATRRRNAIAKTLTGRAKKAWATRRQNEAVKEVNKLMAR